MPDRVGRYRITDRIGFGGMGEVFLAEDEELGRTVAIKTLPQMMIDDRELKARLRHEAETVARINHPSVAQIHDIVSEDDRYFLVLEHVEGENLAAVLGAGPMEVEKTINLAMEIADGLAAAHAQGIIHRDLKPENVMVTPEGKAKILDFGLATVLRGGEIEGSRNAPGRSGLAGTLSAMSPEQAEGKIIEASSDLFSLGILLYHMLTSEHPFRTSVPVETMQRIGSFVPPPPDELNPGVPPDLAHLTMQLLEKDPAARPSGASIVGDRLRAILNKMEAANRKDAESASGRRRMIWGTVIALTTVCLLGGAWWMLRPPPPPPFTVAILKPTQTGATDSSDLPSVVSGLRFATVNALNTIEGAQVINPREIDAISGDLRQIAHAVAADELITMAITPKETTVTVEINRLSGEENRLLWATQVEVPADNLRLLADTITANLQTAYPRRKRRAGAFRITAEPQAYRDFLIIWKKVMSPAPELSWPETLTELRRIRKSAPRLLNAAVLEASVARFLYETTSNEVYLTQAYEAVQSAKNTAPNDFRTLLAETEVAIAAGDFDTARATLDELKTLEPANLAADQQRARLAQKTGHAEEAYVILTDIATRAPSWKNLLNLAKVERFLGDTEAARKHLIEADRRAPSTLLVMIERAFLELTSGNPAHAETLFLQIITIAPEAQHLANLGNAQLLLHHFGEALISIERSLALGSKSTASMLNVADCHQLMGNDDLAKEWYRRTIESQPDDRPLQAGELEIRAQAMAQLGRTEEALRTIHQALDLDPESPHVLYAAALVFSLTDRPDQAAVYFERALDAGINPRWFDLPWFDGITPSSHAVALDH